jgi:hypothetical protein
VAEQTVESALLGMEDVTSVADSGPKKLFLSFRKYDLVCSSWIRILDPDRDPDFLHIPDPGVKKAPDHGSGSATLRLTCLIKP